MKKITIKYNIFYNLLFFIIYKILLDISYFYIISPIWSYSGFILNINRIKLYESYFLLIFIYIIMPKSQDKISSIMCWILILISYVPLLTIYAFMNESRIYLYAITCFWVLVFLMLNLPTLLLRNINKNLTKFILFIISFILIAFTISMMFKYFKISINLNLANVYDVRSEYSKKNNIPFLGYVFTWTAYVILPFVFSITIYKKRYLFSILIILLQILLFSITGNKTYLFALPLVLALIFMLNKKNYFLLMTLGLVCIILIGILSNLLINDLWISSLFTRRTLLLPARLSFIYYDFFSNNPHTFLSQHHIFNKFFNYPYEVAPPYLIAQVYFNAPEMSANNGIYADAFMNFGFYGFIIWALIITIFMKIIDSCSKNKDKRLIISVLCMPLIAITNSAFLTCLITHGLLLSIVIIYLLPKKSEKSLCNK